MRTGRILLGSVALAVALSSCTADKHTIVTTRETTLHATVTQTTQQPPTFRPTPATTVPPLVPGQVTAAGEVEKACPYILSSQDQGPVSMADLEGDRIYRTTVLTGLKPVGCRFYFYAPPYEAVAEITTHTFGTAAEAHDGIVLTSRTGTAAQGKTAIVPGVDAVVYRTKFFGPDGARDWACAFAKGKVMVIVRTQRFDSSLNAVNIAQAIAPKF